MVNKNQENKKHSNDMKNILVFSIYIL